MVFFWAFSAHASITLSPSAVSFYNVPVGGYGPSRTVYVYNQSAESTFLNVSDNCFNDFYVMNYCGRVRANGSCQISIQFNPRQEGYSSCTINVHATTGGGFGTISVQGQAVRR